MHWRRKPAWQVREVIPFRRHLLYRNNLEVLRHARDLLLFPSTIGEAQAANVGKVADYGMACGRCAISSSKRLSVRRVANSRSVYTLLMSL